MATFNCAKEVIDGDEYHLRELSGLQSTCVQVIEDVERQGFALIALSMTDAAGAPKFTPETLDAGIAFVLDLPLRVTRQLTAAVEVLNSPGMDDARKN